jgi:SAM-dependent methyltransferase
VAEMTRPAANAGAAQYASDRDVLNLIDETIDLVASWPVEGDEFFVDYVRARIEYYPYLVTLRHLRDRHPRGRVLDIGAGSGIMSLAASAMGLETWALDLPGREWLRPWLEGRGVRYVLHDLSKPGIPLKEGQFDVIVFQDVIEHLPFSSRGIFREFHRLLKPGGELIVCTPNLTRIATRVKLLLGRTVHPPLPYFWGSEFPFPGHYREYTGKEIHQMLEWSGFVPLELRYVNRATAGRLWRVRRRWPSENPSRLATWMILAQLAFDVALGLRRNLGQTIWASGSTAP